MSAQVEKNTNSSSNANKRPNPASNTSSAKDNKPKPKDDANENASNKNQTAKKDLKKQETQNDVKKEEAKSNKVDDKQSIEKKTPNKGNDKGSEDKKKPAGGNTEKKDKESASETSQSKKKLDDKKNQETENAKETGSKQDKSSEKDTKASSAKDKGNVKEKDSKEANAKDAKDKGNVKENAKDKGNVKESAKDKEVKEESKKEKETEKVNDAKDNSKETKKLNDSKTEKAHVENGVEESSSDTKSKTKDSQPSPGVKAKIKDSPSVESKNAVNAKPNQAATNEVELEQKVEVQSKKEKEESNSTGAFNKEVHKISPRGKTRGRNTPTTQEHANATPIGKRALNEESPLHYSFSTSPKKSSLLDDVKSTPLDIEFNSPSLRECFNSSAHRISGRRSLRSITRDRDISFQPTYNQSYRKRTPEFEATISSLNATRGSDAVISTSFSFVNRAGVKRPQSESSLESSDKQSECETKPKRPRLDFGGWFSFVTSPVAKLYGCFRKNQYNVVTDDGDAKSAKIENVSSVEHHEVMEISHDEEEQEVKEPLDESLDDTIIDDEEDLSLLKNQSDDDDLEDLVKEKHQLETDTQIVADAATTRRNCRVM